MLRLHLIWCGSGSWIHIGKKWIRIQIRIRIQVISLRLCSFWLIFYPLDPDPHILADPDPGSQNLADPDPKHCSNYDDLTYLMFDIFPIPYNIFFPRNLKYLVDQSIKYLIPPPLKLAISSVNVLQITTVQHRQFSLLCALRVSYIDLYRLYLSLTFAF